MGLTKNVDFETAKLLKKKRFGMDNEDYIQLPSFYEEDGTYTEYDVHVSRKYNPHYTHLGADTIDDFKAHLTMMDNSLDEIFLAPTLAKVVMWLYEKHGIWIIVTPIPYSDNLTHWRWEYKSVEYVTRNANWKKQKDYTSPVEAYEAAIKYCLANLI